MRDPASNPWPQWPLIFRTDYGHEEVTLHYGRDPRNFSIATKEFLPTPDGTAVAGLRVVTVRWEREDPKGPMKLVEVPGTAIPQSTQFSPPLNASLPHKSLLFLLVVLVNWALFERFAYLKCAMVFLLPTSYSFSQYF